MKNLILNLFLILLLIISGFLLGVYYSENKKNIVIDNNNIKVTGDSDIINHSDVKYNDKKLKFNTDSKGKGNISTEINLIQVPEIYKWNNKNNIIKINYHLDKNVGVEYNRRYDVYLFGFGLSTSTDIYITAGMMF